MAFYMQQKSGFIEGLGSTKKQIILGKGPEREVFFSIIAHHSTRICTSQREFAQPLRSQGLQPSPEVIVAKSYEAYVDLLLQMNSGDTIRVAELMP